MSQMNVTKKIDVPAEHWGRLFAPSACPVMITTVDGEGRINAASFGTCVRVRHDPSPGSNFDVADGENPDQPGLGESGR